MINNGEYFNRTLKALNLDDEGQVRDTTRNASDIVSSIIKGYGGTVEQGINPESIPQNPVIGLVYGRIQSGKTRAMIASTAMSFDNGFRISIVMTSNINDLVNQTHFDFTTGLPGVMTYTKDNDLKREVDITKTSLEMGTACLLIVCSKAKGSLENISNFLTDIGAKNYPTIIFDDEGDQASLDTNTRRRSRATSAVSVAPSTINNAIQNKLRTSVPKHVYVSVTGTPQAVLLQSADATHRPSFIVMLPPGSSYVGGNYFFNDDEPEDNPNKLISLVDDNEKEQLLDNEQPIPVGLKESILFFLVSAAAAVIRAGVPSKGYSYLCHPSLKNKEQDDAEKRINVYLTEIIKVLLGGDDNADILDGLEKAYEKLSLTLEDEIPDISEIKRIISEQLPTRRVLIINTKVKRQGINYCQGFNFLIGGNTLGRGISIKDLLVTYYVRDAKISQIDTMHQHARMFGYRMKTLKYTRLFITRSLYYKFRDIHRSDNDSREFIEKNKETLPTTFPIEYTYNLRTTRPGVLDVNKTGTLRSGMHIYPNYINIPQKEKSYNKIVTMLKTHFNVTSDNINDIEHKSNQDGVLIAKEEVINIIKLIKTSSKNTWRDKSICAVIDKVSNHFDGRVLLKFRTAKRKVRNNGFLSTGTLSGDELSAARSNLTHPTLWIMSTITTEDSEVAHGELFMYPTFVIPESFPSLFMFSQE